jgi:argininosuccinate synthase
MRLDDVASEHVGVCVSGGLSSLAVVASLADSGIQATALVADIGQASSGYLELLAHSLETAGIRAVVVDLTAEMAGMALDLVRYLARYEGGYWNSTSSSRLVLVQGLTPAMRETGCTVLAHGCVGGGNDQRRFERYATWLAPELGLFAPWTEPDLLGRFPDRETMEKYVRGRDLALADRCDADYSVDGNLAGFSHESTALEGLGTPESVARLLMTVPAQQAPDQPEIVSIRFDRGRPVAIDGSVLGPRELLQRVNAIAGRHGIGTRTVVENRINGTKCRGVYESPGLDLLGFCISKVYEIALDREARKLLAFLSELIGRGVYEGRYHEVAVRAGRAAADSIVEAANATVTVELYKGSLSFLGISGYSDEKLPPRQTRFTGGGHSWQVTA